MQPNIKSITSVSNSYIKHIVALTEKSKMRRETGTFVVEGRKEVELAIQNGYHLLTLIFQPKIISQDDVLPSFLKSKMTDVEVIEVSHQVYSKIAYRSTTEGVIGVFKDQKHILDDLVFKTDSPLVLVAEAPEKPGNIGALLRTADAAGVDAFIIANPNTDLYNPNIIRSGIGCLFVNQVAMGSTDEVIAFLKNRNIKIICATLSHDSVSCYSEDLTGSLAIVVGTESTGLEEKWINAADRNVIIPMAGQIDSMNVSVSAAILVFEAVRQRRHS